MAESSDACLVVTSLTALPSESAIRETAREVVDLELGAPRRLAATGIEFECGSVAADRLNVLRVYMQQHGADVNCLPTANREKRLLICDMDSTIITTECIDEVANRAGVGEEVAAITERAMRGELNFAESLVERLQLCAGLAEAELETIWRERVRLHPGAATLVRTMAARGALTALVSGGYTFFVDRVAQEVGFANTRANRLEIVDGHLTGRAIPPILDAGDKLVALQEYCAEAGIEPIQAAAVGDGANDADMIKAAGLGVGWQPKPILTECADAVLNHSGLDAILCLQGIPESDWIQS